MLEAKTQTRDAGKEGKTLLGAWCYCESLIVSPDFMSHENDKTRICMRHPFAYLCVSHYNLLYFLTNRLCITGWMWLRDTVPPWCYRDVVFFLIIHPLYCLQLNMTAMNYISLMWKVTTYCSLEKCSLKTKKNIIPFFKTNNLKTHKT